MTRDMELVRKILLAIWASERPFDSVMMRIGNYSPEQISEHIRLLYEARLVEGNAILGADRRQRWSELRLTWTGHDFIEAARNDAIWRMSGEALSTSNGTASLEMWRVALIEASFILLGRASDGSRVGDQEQYIDK